jgi:predicted tellurium resistance membrane protein TerC
MAGACLVSIVFADSVFALDSALFVVSASRTTFIVVTSSILATFALRSWLFMIDTIKNLRFPRVAIAILLGVIGLKMIAQQHAYVPHAVWLATIAGILGIGVVGSALETRRNARQR